EGKLLACREEGCGRRFHMGCLKPPLSRTPKEGDWSCPICRKRKAHAEREAKAQAKRDQKKRELAAKLAKSPVKTIKLEATDGPRNIIGIILPERSVESVCDALRGYEAELEKQREAGERREREEKEARETVERDRQEAKRAQQAMKLQERNKQKGKARGGGAGAGAGAGASGDVKEEAVEAEEDGGAAPVLSSLDGGRGSFNGDLVQLLQGGGGARAAKRTAMQQMKRD
ncbi:unnamed protein product, partial [Ectocarpus fasciculatus]